MKLYLCTLIVIAISAISFIQGQPPTYEEDPFRQIHELLPSPNESRLASGAPGPKYWQQRVDYNIQVHLDDEKQRLVGSEKINYRNNSPHELKYLWVQLDQNRFAPGSDESLTKEAPGLDNMSFQRLRSQLYRETFQGGHKIKSVFNQKGKPIKHEIVGTMMRIDLDDPMTSGSNFIFHHIKENYSEFLKFKKKFLVIFRGINVDYFDSSTKLEVDEKKLLAKWEIQKEKKIILVPGRLTSWKGQEMFIEAVNLVKIELGYEAFHVVILGSDQGRNLYKKKLVRLSEQYRLTNQIKFIDHCDDMALAYKVSDIIISPSIEPEAFGRVAVEAQSMEKLIIASNIGGSNETIINEKTGLLFEAGDADSLSKKIISAITMDEMSLELMGKEGRKNVLKKFNVEKMCFSTYSEYKRLLN